MIPPLSEQVVLITGASAGIGASLATALSNRYPGIRLVLTARRVDRLEAIASECANAGEVVVIPADLTVPDQIQALSQQTLDKMGRLDALVCNAGYGQMGPVEMIPTEAVQRQFQVNVTSVIALTQAFIPKMREQGGGRIITLSSIAGRIAFPMTGVYCASKFALEALSDALRQELSPFNIAVSVVEPGPVSTEFVDVAKQFIEQSIDLDQPNPYQAAFDQFAQMEDQMTNQSWSPNQVAEVICQALSDRHPQPRYVAATGGDLLIFLMTKVLPTGLTDNLWKRFYGIDRIEQDWTQTRGA